MRRAAVIVPLLASLLIMGAMACVRNHRSESFEVVEVPLSNPYLKVVASMGKKASFEAVLESGGAKLVERNWDEFKFDLREMPRLSSWEMKGRGKFKVRSTVSEFSGEMAIEQTMRADRIGVVVESKLSSPCGCVKQHDTVTIIKNSRPTILRIENKFVYERAVPFWMADEMDSRVAARNRSKVEAMASVIRSIAEGEE